MGWDWPVLNYIENSGFHTTPLYWAISISIDVIGNEQDRNAPSSAKSTVTKIAFITRTSISDQNLSFFLLDSSIKCRATTPHCKQNNICLQGWKERRNENLNANAWCLDFDHFQQHCVHAGGLNKSTSAAAFFDSRLKPSHTPLRSCLQRILFSLMLVVSVTTNQPSYAAAMWDVSADPTIRSPPVLEMKCRSVSALCSGFT